MLHYGNPDPNCERRDSRELLGLSVKIRRSRRLKINDIPGFTF